MKNIDKSYMICVLAPRLARQTQPARADAPLAVSAAQPTPQRLQGHARLCQLAFWAVQQWQCLAGTVRRPQSWHNEPQLLGKQGQDHAVSLARLGLCSSCSYGHWHSLWNVIAAASACSHARYLRPPAFARSSLLREPSVQNVLCWARQPLKIKTNNNWFLIQTVAKEKHVGFSQPATASHETMKQIAAEKKSC